VKKLAAAAVVLGLAIAGFLVMKRSPQKKARTRLVPFPVVRLDLSSSVKASGTVEPRNLVPVRAPIHGRMEELREKVGRRVEKGAALALMSSTDRAAILDESLSRGATTYEKWKEFYRPTTVVAPVAGLIINRKVVKGEAVRLGEELFTIADELVVAARADETDVTAIREGQDASLRFDAYPDKKFPAKVASVGLQAERVEGVSVYKVVLKPLKKPRGLKTGMSVEASFVVSRKEKTLAVPAAAVGGRSRARVRALVGTSPKEKPAWRMLSLGISDGRFVEVLSGVEEGHALLVPEAALQPPPGPR
jgi:macrolide-specific efflux system membrane fusion protein